MILILRKQRRCPSPRKPEVLGETGSFPGANEDDQCTRCQTVLVIGAGAEHPMALLRPGDKFPALAVALPGGGGLQLPDAFAGQLGVVLFCRGSWCPYCNAQLSAFQRARERLAGVEAQVVALSVDDEAATADLINRTVWGSPPATARTLTLWPRPPARWSTTTRYTCSQPGSCSTLTAGSSSASTPAVPSDGWCPRMSSASSVTGVPIRPEPSRCRRMPGQYAQVWGVFRAHSV